MNHLERAKIYEAQDKLADAFDEYCLAIEKSEEIEEEDYINASFLAFIFQDYGYAEGKNIPVEKAGEAYPKIYAILKASEEKYGCTSQIDFWCKYYSHILEGVEETSDTWFYFLNAGVLEAIICLPRESIENLPDTQMLLQKAKSYDCAKHEYIRSMINNYV